MKVQNHACLATVSALVFCVDGNVLGLALLQNESVDFYHVTL